MPFNSQLHHRRSIRLRDYDYSQNGVYFITVCVQNKTSLFGKISNDEIINNSAGKMIVAKWNELVNRFINIELDEFIVMPNHLHGIIIINEQDNVGVPLVGTQTMKDNIHVLADKGQARLR